MHGMNNIKEMRYLCSISGYHIRVPSDSENHLTIRLQFKNTNCVNFDITFVLKVKKASWKPATSIQSKCMIFQSPSLLYHARPVYL